MRTNFSKTTIRFGGPKIRKSLLSVRGMKGRVSSGGYSNLGTRVKDFQKLMSSKKEKQF